MANRQYEYIRAWGIMLGSQRYYIDDQVALATKDHAPDDALYRNDDGTWETVSGSTTMSPSTRATLERTLEQMVRGNR